MKPVTFYQGRALGLRHMAMTWGAAGVIAWHFDLLFGPGAA